MKVLVHEHDLTKTDFACRHGQAAKDDFLDRQARAATASSDSIAALDPRPRVGSIPALAAALLQAQYVDQRMGKEEATWATWRDYEPPLVSSEALDHWRAYQANNQARRACFIRAPHGRYVPRGSGNHNPGSCWVVAPHARRRGALGAHGPCTHGSTHGSMAPPSTPTRAALGRFRGR